MSVLNFHYRSRISLYITAAYILSVKSLNHWANGSLLPRNSGMCVLTVKYMSSTDFAISILPLHSMKIRFSRSSSVKSINNNVNASRKYLKMLEAVTDDCTHYVYNKQK